MSNKYKFENKIYNGKFSNTYYDYINKVIIKQFININLYRNERVIYKQLEKIDNIPKVIECFKKDKIYHIVLNYVGITLKTFKKKYYSNNNYLFYIKYLSIDLISIIEKIHNLNVLHRDLKPDNICIKNNNIYLIDFGYSSKYTYKNNHVDNKKITSVIGSYDYISENVLNLNNPSRRDDIESVLYILIFLLLNKNNFKKYNKVEYTIKKNKNIIIEILENYFLNNIELKNLIYYIKNIKYHEKPLYQYFKYFIYNNLNLKI
tara:strand:+ start:1742 stop:2527 length:786 start_codon:yes stop_codon:yes gene_type:complete